MQEKMTCDQLQQQYRDVKNLRDAYVSALYQAGTLANLDKRYAGVPDEHPGKHFYDAVAALRERIRAYKVENVVTPEQAREIFGEDNFIGPEDIHNTFGFTPEDIPRIPFSKEEIARAKELGQQLILYVDTKDGVPFTAEDMIDSVNNKASDGNPVLYGRKALNEYGITDVCPRSAWRLTTPEVLENTTNKNYLDQTEALIDYLKDEVFKDTELPESYQKAITEFESKKDVIQDHMTLDWEEAARQLTTLAINQLTRENVAEVIYRLIIAERKNKTRNLRLSYTWTTTLDSDGFPMRVGHLTVDVWELEDYYNDLGVCFSRSGS